MNSLLITQNILKRAFANKKETLALLLLPVVVISLIGFFVNRAAAKIPALAVINLDKGSYALDLAEKLRSRPDLNVTVSQGSEEDRADLMVRIPAGFSADIAGGKKVQVSLTGKESDPAGQSLRQLLNRTILSYYGIAEAGRELAVKTGGNSDALAQFMLDQAESGSISAAYRLAGPDKDTARRQALSSTMGFALVFIMILVFSVMGTILEDKKRLTLARMSAAPVQRWEVIAGNLLGGLALGLIQLVPLVLVLKFLFKLPWGAGLLNLFLTLLCFLIAAIGLGIGLSGIVRDNFNPTMIIATVITPTSIIGGSFIPPSMLPSFINKIGWAVPQKWVMQSFQQIMAGSGFKTIAVNLGILLVFALAFASFGLKTLQPVDE